MRYASIRDFDISNGEGIGVALFVQGCHFHCKNCFNESTWDFDGGKEWTDETESAFLKLLEKPYIKRVSILGGEPLAKENRDTVLDLIKKISGDISVWVYTGYKFEDLNDVNISPIDVLVDGQFDYTKQDFRLKFRGSSNQRIIDVKRTIETGEINELITE